MEPTTDFAYVLTLVRPDMLATGPTPHEIAVIERHHQYLSELTERGVALFVGRTLVTSPDTFGIAVIRVSSELEAEQTMANDPAVAESVLSGRLYPFKVVLHSLGRS